MLCLSGFELYSRWVPPLLKRTSALIITLRSLARLSPSCTHQKIKAHLGPWFGKFNNSLLQNEEFVTKLKFLIQNSKEKFKELNY